MIRINGTNWTIREFGYANLPEHLQHYFNDATGAVAKVNVHRDERGRSTYDVHLSTRDDRDYLSVYGVSSHKAVELIDTHLRAEPVEEGDPVSVFVNQGKRYGFVEKIARTRVRISYEMPNAGEVGGWWRIIRRENGIAFIVRNSNGYGRC